MREIYEELRRKGLQQELKNWKDSSGKTALMRATVGGHHDICQWLLKQDLVDVNSKNFEGWNALHFAANFYRTEIISLLLNETSIDVNEQTDDGWTALDFGAQIRICRGRQRGNYKYIVGVKS